MDQDLINRLEDCDPWRREDSENFQERVTGLCREAAIEIRRLRDLVDSQQHHGETYGRRSGGAKEVLFK